VASTQKLEDVSELSKLPRVDQGKERITATIYDIFHSIQPSTMSETCVEVPLLDSSNDLTVCGEVLKSSVSNSSNDFFTAFHEDSFTSSESFAEFSLEFWEKTYELYRFVCDPYRRCEECLVLIEGSFLASIPPSFIIIVLDFQN
jgi:hypothetical protein